MIITVEGLAASGKGTISRAFARAFGFVHVDAGLIFRSVAFAPEHGISLFDDNLSSDLQYFWDGESASIMLRGRNITKELSGLKHARNTAMLASDPESFRKLCEIVKCICLDFPNIIADGRSVSADIFPEHDFSFYIDAPFTVRAFRRFKDLNSAGQHVSFCEVSEALRERDALDLSRVVSPAKKQLHAVRIFSHNKSVDDCVKEMACKVASSGYVL